GRWQLGRRRCGFTLVKQIFFSKRKSETMSITKFFTLILSCSLFISNASGQDNNVSNYVNPFVGTGGHGHTFPGAVMPFGMVQLSPDTRLEGWDGCSGYHYTDKVVYGFS